MLLTTFTDGGAQAPVGPSVATPLFAMCVKRRREKRRKSPPPPPNFGHSYLGNGQSDFLQIWNVDSPTTQARVQQLWLQLDKE